VFDNLLETRLQERDACILVSECDGELIGYVSGSARTAFYVGGMTAWVDEILVLPDRRGEGVGRSLMAAFEAWAASKHCHSVALATSGAAHFYEQRGYATKAGYFKKVPGRSVARYLKLTHYPRRALFEPIDTEF